MLLIWVYVYEFVKGKQCVPEMETRGEAVYGSQREFELCWVEDGR